MQAFYDLQKVDTGFDAERVMTMRVALPRAGYPSRAEADGFFDEALGLARGLRGVEAAATINNLPLNFELHTRSFEVDGRPSASADEKLAAAYRKFKSDQAKKVAERNRAVQDKLGS